MKNNYRQPVYYVTPQSTVIPGLKVAYGLTANSIATPEESQDSERKSWLSRLKNTVWHFVTEESEIDRPIGLTQLSRNTFMAHPNASNKTFVKNSNLMQDYRFRFITESR